jgi:hypothetical protein
MTTLIEEGDQGLAEPVMPRREAPDRGAEPGLPVPFGGIFDINLSRLRKVLTLRAGQHKLTEPMATSPKCLPQRLVQQPAGWVPLLNRI